MQKTFGPLIVDLLATEMQPDEREIIEHPLVGGVILFSRNYESPQQLQALVNSIRAIPKNLLIMVDQEGGRVQRFRTEFTRIPPAAFYAKMERPLEIAEIGGWVMATELLAYGIDLSLAPILDIDKGMSSVIGDRAFHQKSSHVINLASAYIQGMKKAGMVATGKHFPGHGSVVADSHQELPVDHRSYAMIEKEDLQPFLHFIKNKIPALMTAHILFTAVDDMPVSFSRTWLRDILRDRLQFEGVVMSDDLDMKGADGMGDYADRVHTAYEAGCDIILLCNNRPAVIQVLDRTPPAMYLLDNAKYEMLRGNFKALDKQLWQTNRDLLLKYSEDIYDDCK